MVYSSNISSFFYQTFETEESAVEVEPDADKEISQTEQSSDYQHHATSILKDHDSAQLLPSPDSVSVTSAEDKDDPTILDFQEDIPNRQAAFISILYEDICLCYSCSFCYM